MNKTSNWTFVVFDLTAEEFARRVRLLRELRKEGAAMHSQSVYCAPYTESSFRSLENVAENNALIFKAEVSEGHVKELVDAYDTYIGTLFSDVETKIDELEDAKVIATEDTPSKRGYSKRLRKMYERLDHLDYVSSLRDTVSETDSRAPSLSDIYGVSTEEQEIRDAVDAFRQRVEHIDNQPPGEFL